MTIKKTVLRFVCFCLSIAAFCAASLRAQTNCTADAAAAIECFVANAVATNLTAPRHGLTLAQFQAYGVAVSQILHTHHSYLMLLATASSAADAMPPINASGTPNQAAQTAALDAIVAAELTTGFVSLPQGVVLQDLQWFAEDVAVPMNNNQGYLQLLTPGAALRLLDTYVVAATTPGAGGAPSTVDWQKVEASISNAVDAFTNAGIIMIPPGETATKLKTLMQDVAQVIIPYGVSFSHIDYDISTLDASTSDNYDVGLYGPCAVNTASCPLVTHIGAQNETTTGYKQQSVTSVTIQPGLYWIAITANAATAQVAPTSVSEWTVCPSTNSTTTSSGGALPSTIATPNCSAPQWTGQAVVSIGLE